MYYNFFCLLISLLAIVVAASLFCNALEHLGEKLGFADGVTGSIFAAVATALPETIIPILAVLKCTLFDSGDTNVTRDISHEIGLGAILGAPLMLSTLSVFVMAVSVIKSRGIMGKISPEISSISRDLRFFLFSYALAFSAIFVQQLEWHAVFNGVIVLLLAATYSIYIILTIKESKQHVAMGNKTTATEALFLHEKFHLKSNLRTIILQAVIALTILIYFANLFITIVTDIATNYHISAFLLSLFIIPLATELPEKVNSIMWLAKRKDTLALGNITGAMMFQGSLLPIIGILFTNWSINSILPILGIGITFIATLWFYFNLRRGQLVVWRFALNGLLYVIYLSLCIIYFESGF